MKNLYDTQKNPCFFFHDPKNPRAFLRPPKIPFGQNFRPKTIPRTPPPPPPSSFSIMCEWGPWDKQKQQNTYTQQSEINLSMRLQMTELCDFPVAEMFF